MHLERKDIAAYVEITRLIMVTGILTLFGTGGMMIVK